MADAAALAEATGSRFREVELIGRGSFGDVYKGYVQNKLTGFLVMLQLQCVVPHTLLYESAIQCEWVLSLVIKA